MVKYSRGGFECKIVCVSSTGVFCQTAAILVSQTGSRADRLKCYSLPKMFDPPRGNLSCCSTFLILPRQGQRERKDICSYFASDVSIRTHTCVADR